MAQTHPTTDMLMGYAAGTLSDGWSLMVASHLTFCPECRRRVETLECVAGALLQGSEAVEVATPSLDTVLSRIAATPQEAAPGPSAPIDAMPPAENSVLPAALRARLGGDETSISWRFRIPGLSEHVLDAEGGESVSLLRARPGVRMLAHTHGGDEATLVFSGAMKDGDRVYRKGDVALADEADDHRPEIVGEEVCYCLIVMSGSLRFTGRFGKMLNIFN